MRNRGYSKKFLASGRALLSMLATAAVILGGLVFLPREIRAKEKEFKGFGNHGAAISEDGRYYSNGYFEKTNNGLPDREKKATYNCFTTITADGGNSEADSFAFCLANGKRFPTYKDEGKAEGVYRMVRNIDEDMYAKLLAENHKFSHIANKKLAWETFSRLAYIYLADPTGIVKRAWGKTDDATILRARDAFHQVIQLEIWRYTDGFLVSPTQNYFEYKYLSNEQKKALELVRQEMWNFAVPYDQLEYRFYKPEFKRGAGYQALGTVRFKQNTIINVKKIWVNLDNPEEKPDTYVRLLHDGNPVMVHDPAFPNDPSKQQEAVQKIDNVSDQAVFEGAFNLDVGIWSVEEVMPDDQGGWKTWKAEGYTSGKPEKVDDRHFTITNTKQPNPKVVKVRKFWFNMGESTAVPDDVYFALYKNSTDTKPVDIKKLEKNAVSVEFPIDNSADIKQYTVKETDAAGNPWKKDGYADPVVKKVLDGVFEVSNEKKDPPKIKVKVKKVDKDQPDKLLVGANLMIEKHPFPGKYLDADWQTTGKVDEIELPAGGYRLFEKETPLGYKCAADIYFKIDDQGNVSVSGTDPKGLYVASIDKTITMADEKDTTTGSKLTDVTLSKKAVNGTDELPGAKLQVVQIVSKQGQNPYSKLVEEWTSDKDKGAKTIKLPEGEYMMVETTAPNGYEVAESITFKVDAKGKVSVRGENGNFVNRRDSTVTMIDKPKQPEKTFFVNLSKKAVNGTAELPGAKLKVLKGYSENGQLVEEWTSDKSSKEIHLAPGVYTMVETTAPNGYEVAESITFKVEADGKVSVLGKDGNFGNPGDPTVTMWDKEKTFSVNLSKKAVNGTDELPGAKLKVFKGYSENEQVVEEWTSGTSSKDIQLAPGVYTMVETTAPNGYEVAESITFKVDADGKVSVLGKDGNFGNPGDPTVTMRDKEKTFSVNLSKKVVNGTDELPGAKLKVLKGYSENGQLVEEWTSGNSSKAIQLAPGVYTMVETTAPNGYEVAESITFKVEANGKVSIKSADGNFVTADKAEVVMYDKPKQPGTEGGKHKVTFPKDAETSEDDPKGEHTTLKIVEGEDPNGNTTVGESWKPGKEDKNVDLKPGTYTLVKVVKKDGQEVTETVTFKVDNNGKISVKNKDGDFVKKDDKTITTKDKEKTTPQQPGGKHKVTFPKGAETSEDDPDGKNTTLKIVEGEDPNGQTTVGNPWNPGTEDKITELKPGTYTLVKVVKKDGGKDVTETVTFKVDNNGEISVKNKDGDFVKKDDKTITTKDKEKTTPQQPGGKHKVTFPKDAETSEDDPKGEHTTLKIVEGEDPNGNTTVGESWKPGKEDKNVDLKPGTYTLVKVVKKDGGKDVTETVTFKVDNNGEISVKNKDGDFVKKDGNTITTKDKEKTTPQQPGGKHKVTFPKDAETSEDDPKGEHTTLKIVEGEDPNGNTTVGESWKPGTEDKNVDLKPGTYTLVKVVKKDGGKDVTETVTFKVDNNGEISVKNKDGNYVEKDDKTITTKDKEKTNPQQPGGKHKVTFQKDAETSEDDPKGEHTTLKIVEGEDPNGNTTVGESWKPGKEDKNVDLKPGTYTLVKVVEKDGRQEVTESVTFRVEKDGKISVKNKDGDFVKKDGNTITTKDKEKPTPQQPGEEPSQNHGTLFPPVILQQPGSTDTPQQVEVTKKTAKPSSARAEVTPQTPQADVPKTGEATTQPILPVVLILAGLSLVGVVLRRQTKQIATKD